MCREQIIELGGLAELPVVELTGGNCNQIKACKNGIKTCLFYRSVYAMAGNGMEVDPPSSSGSVPGQSHTVGPGLLKRSNSAPMINVIASSEASPNSSINSQPSPANSTASGPSCSLSTSSLGQVHVYKG